MGPLALNEMELRCLRLLGTHMKSERSLTSILNIESDFFIISSLFIIITAIIITLTATELILFVPMATRSCNMCDTHTMQWNQRERASLSWSGKPLCWPEKWGKHEKPSVDARNKKFTLFSRIKTNIGDSLAR